MHSDLWKFITIPKFNLEINGGFEIVLNLLLIHELHNTYTIKKFGALQITPSVLWQFFPFAHCIIVAPQIPIVALSQSYC